MSKEAAEYLSKFGKEHLSIAKRAWNTGVNSIEFLLQTIVDAILGFIKPFIAFADGKSSWLLLVISLAIAFLFLTMSGTPQSLSQVYANKNFVEFLKQTFLAGNALQATSSILIGVGVAGAYSAVMKKASEVLAELIPLQSRSMRRGIAWVLSIVAPLLSAIIFARHKTFSEKTLPLAKQKNAAAQSIVAVSEIKDERRKLMETVRQNAKKVVSRADQGIQVTDDGNILAISGKSSSYMSAVVRLARKKLGLPSVEKEIAKAPGKIAIAHANVLAKLAKAQAKANSALRAFDGPDAPALTKLFRTITQNQSPTDDFAASMMGIATRFLGTVVAETFSVTAAFAMDPLRFSMSKFAEFLQFVVELVPKLLLHIGKFLGLVKDPKRAANNVQEFFRWMDQRIDAARETFINIPKEVGKNAAKAF